MRRWVDVVLIPLTKNQFFYKKVLTFLIFFVLAILGIIFNKKIDNIINKIIEKIKIKKIKKMNENDKLV